jgi:hypothetical protein
MTAQYWQQKVDEVDVRFNTLLHFVQFFFLFIILDVHFDNSEHSVDAVFQFIIRKIFSRINDHLTGNVQSAVAVQI